MSWESILQNDANTSEPLRSRIEVMFAQQRATWPALRAGEAALELLQRKSLDSDGESIIVQLNPARRGSTQAKTDATSVAARACFLCPQNMPPEERGVTFEELVVLPNPFPVLPLHCTIACRQHVPQRIAGRMASFLQLAEALGPDLVVLYNGPRCGASAPDHFHFQAAAARGIPIFAQTCSFASGRSPTAHSSFGRNILVFNSTDAAEVQVGIERAINVLRRIENSTDEPMFNLIARHDAGHYKAILFPRAAHRPACYFATGPEHLSVSPAVLEMCGVLVTTESDHFERIDAHLARAIYVEVSLAAESFKRLAAAIA
jgi:hypothetical protein